MGVMGRGMQIFNQKQFGYRRCFEWMEQGVFNCD